MSGDEADKGRIFLRDLNAHTMDETGNYLTPRDVTVPPADIGKVVDILYESQRCGNQRIEVRRVNHGMGNLISGYEITTGGGPGREPEVLARIIDAQFPNTEEGAKAKASLDSFLPKVSTLPYDWSRPAENQAAQNQNA